MSSDSAPAKVDWLLHGNSGSTVVPVEERIVIDDDDWRATIERIEVGAGLRVFLASAQVRRSLTLEPQHTEPAPWLVGDIAVKGRVSLSLTDGPSAEITPERSVLFRPADRRARFTPAPHQSLRLAGYMVRADRIRQMFGGDVPDVIVRMIDGDPPTSPLIEIPASGRLRRLAAMLFSEPLHGPLRLVFMEGVVLQLLALQAAGHGEYAKGKTGLTRKVSRAVAAAHERLVADLRNPPTLGDLAVFAGLSEKALNAGFATLYGGTVFEVLRNERLEHARIAMETADISLKEVAFRLGYRHVTNFISAFTRRYGNPPTRYARQRQTEPSQSGRATPGRSASP